jgi:hypothetical protein
MKQNLEVITNIVVLIAALLAIVFGFGVVWRVEKKLDLSFKFFLSAIIAFFSVEISKFFYIPENGFLIYIEPAGKILFALLFLAGMATMRNMIRGVDGEK